MDCSNFIESNDSPYKILLTAASLIPISHYFFGFLFISLAFLYNFLEIHFIQDLFTCFRGQPVCLTFNSCSDVYQEVVSKCSILHGRYLATPWLSSPHLQTVFLSSLGRGPAFTYRRQLFHLSDGGTIALDWLRNSNVTETSFQSKDTITEDDKTTIVVVIPGLTSDSAAVYVKHCALKMAKSGWNVVVSNHRGLGGISITSDCIYNGGWTKDIREVIDHLHHRYPEAPLFVVGTSVGANVLVKYLGEDGLNSPIAGAVAVCSPWDPLICDRFLHRRALQRIYNKALALGLVGYAQLHQHVYSRLADWEGILKSRSVREYDYYGTRLLGKFETVDTYYRQIRSSAFVGNVTVPLLCISALDDPVCTKEAIPWDECRANKNIVLATTQHGGHLAYYQGNTAKSLWWVGAVHEFFSVLHSSSLIRRKKEAQMQSFPLISPPESSIDQGPYINITEDGMVAAMADEQTNVEDINTEPMIQSDKNKDEISETEDGMVAAMADEQTNVEDINTEPMIQSDKNKDEISETQGSDRVMGKQTHLTDESPQPPGQGINDIIMPKGRYVDQLSRHSRKSIWLLAYIAIVTTWPLVGPALRLFFKKRFRNMPPGISRRAPR